MSGGIGQGLPWWLPEGFLNVEQTLALGDVTLDLAGGGCAACAALVLIPTGPGTAQCPPDDPGPIDPAHIVTKGMGGRPNGAGPAVRICRRHHDLEHFSADGIQRTMAIRASDGAVCWLGYDPRRGPGDGQVQVTILGHKHPWEW